LDEIDNNHITLVGFSAGAAVSIYVAAHDKRVSGVVSCASPADFSAITSFEKPQYTIDHFRNIGIIRDPEFPSSLDEWLNDFRKVNTLDNVDNIAPRPLLIIHATGDSVVDVQDAYKLHEKAGEPKQLVIIEGGEHRLRRDDTAVNAIIKWLKENLK
jgi:putative redox protein